MLQLKTAIPLKKLPIPQLQHVGDLIYFDGPLLSEFKTNAGDLFLMYWCDCDAKCNRWMYIRANGSQLALLKARRIPTSDVIPKGAMDGLVYVVDIDSDGDLVECFGLLAEDVPSEYCPEAGATLPEYLQADSDKFFTVPIQGDWDYSELSKFPRELFFAYAFLLSTKSPGDVAYPEWVWHHRGGFAPSYLGDWCISKLQMSERPDLSALQYASPGYMRFEMNGLGVQEVLNVLKELKTNSKIVFEKHQLLFRYMRDNQEDLETPRDDERRLQHSVNLNKLTDELWISLGMGAICQRLKSSTPGAADYAFVTRWFYNRILALTKFSSQEKVLFPL